MESLRWHCTSCDARFEAETSGPRCPKCLKRTTLVRDFPVPAVVDETRAEEPPAPPGARALVAAAVPAVVAAVLMVGLGQPIVALAVCIGVAPLAGFLMTGDRASRIYGTIASVIAGVGVVFGAAYALRRNADALVVPMILGVLPGLTLFFVLRLVASWPVVRIVLAFGALVTTAYIVTSC